MLGAAEHGMAALRSRRTRRNAEAVQCITRDGLSAFAAHCHHARGPLWQRTAFSIDANASTMGIKGL